MLAALTAIPNASAVQYTIAGGTIFGNSVDPGLVVSTQVSSTLTNKSFLLNDGQSTSVDFFDIWTTETAINPDDTQKSNITATLNFSNPFSSGSFGGVTFGGSTWYGAQSRWGDLPGPAGPQSSLLEH